VRIAPNPRAVVSRARAVALTVATIVACAAVAACGGATTDGETTGGSRDDASDAASIEAAPGSTADGADGAAGVTTTSAPAEAASTEVSTTLVSPTGVSTTVVSPASASTTLAPTTTAAGRAGTPRLEVSQTSGLDPAGVRVSVRGTGYDVAKGVYVGVCTQAAPSASAATCIGGVDMGGDSPSLAWVSSNPPAYAVGLTQPYELGGSFVVSILVVARSGDIDCRVLRCGIISRNDHLRYSDRSQDVFVPISFAG